MGRAWIGVAIFFLCGCVHTYDMHAESQRAAPVRIAASSSFYVAIPENGRFDSTEYPHSGEMTAATIAQALSRHTKDVKVAKKVVALDEDLADSTEARSEYLLRPTILHWEERATEWSGKSDRITIRLELFEVDSRERIDSREFSGKSRWGTFGGDHPQELLPVPVRRYVEELFGASES